LCAGLTQEAAYVENVSGGDAAKIESAGMSWACKKTAVKSSATVEGFTSGARMWLRVRAVGADNATGPWSDPAVKTVP
jgi:hypothetical protein